MASPRVKRYADFDVKSLQRAADAASEAIAARPRIAVLIPCFNEAQSIARVVTDFRAALPSAKVYVYDNNSDDETASLARGAGADVRRETAQGKGNVIRRMFADVEADVYVLVDGDGTYDAAIAPDLVKRLLDDRLDMVNVARDGDEDAYRSGHRFGNALLTWMVSAVFGRQISDVLSGYRAFSRRFVKSFPGLSRGFEIEAELTVHALELRLPIGEMRARYRARAEGSASKLSTYRDGVRIVATIFGLIKEERPLQFFASIAAVLAIGALLLAAPLIVTYLETGLVPRFPTAILATGMMLAALLSLACGLILGTVTRGRKEMKRLHYLSIGR